MDHAKRSVLYGSEKLYRCTMQGVSVWNRYHGERYFHHDMVRWTTVVVYRICGNNDINRYCDYLWNSQWSGTGMAGYVTYENDRDFAEHSQSAFGYFSAGDSGEGKCAESVTVDQVRAENPKTVEEFHSGKEKVLGFLVGQVMKKMRGKADPGMVNELLRKKL